jgi:hypothetical protein
MSSGAKVPAKLHRHYVVGKVSRNYEHDLPGTLPAKTGCRKELPTNKAKRGRSFSEELAPGGAGGICGRNHGM